MQVREQHTVEIDGVSYLITALDATYGLKVLNQLQETAMSGRPVPAETIKEIVMKSVSVKGKNLDESSFNTYFSKKYKVLFELFEEISKFNFGDLNDPNEQGDTSEQ